MCSKAKIKCPRDVPIAATSQLPCIFPLLHETNMSLIKQLSLKNRAQAPVLSRDHILSAQSTPHSNVTSASSLFLTPPVSDHYISSPPPKAGAEDYLDATTRPKHKGKYRARHLPKQNKTREDSEETTLSTQLLLKSGPSAFNSPGNCCPSCGSTREVRERPYPANHSLRKGRTFPAQLSTGSLASREPTRIHRANTRLSVTFPPEPSDSPALESLRRLSQSGEKPPTNVLRRLSRTFTSSLIKSVSDREDTKNQGVDHTVRVPPL